MTSLSEVHRRCLEIIEEMPKQPWTVRPKNSEGGPPPTAQEIAEALKALTSSNQAQIDGVCGRLTLDWHWMEEDAQTWFLVEMRVRAAVYFLELLGQTLKSEEQILLPWETADDALEWALVRLWKFAGPQWLVRAARLVAAGMDLSSRESPPAVF